MKITRYICDACGAETLNIKRIILPDESDREYEGNVIKYYGERVYFKDLCFSCYYKVLDILNQNDISYQMRGY